MTRIRMPASTSTTLIDPANSGLPLAQPLVAAELASVRLRRQWIVTREESTIIPEALTIPLGRGYRLYYHRDAAVQVVRRADAVVVIIGRCVFDDREEDVAPALRHTPASTTDAICSLARSLVGAYAILVGTFDGVHAISDPACLMGMYHNGSELASTPVLVARHGRDPIVDAQYALAGTDDWYTGSVCPFSGVHAVLANHVFALPSLAMRRFWPLQAPEYISVGDAVYECALRFRRSLAQLAREAPVLASITGGLDSRVCIAAMAAEGLAPACFTIAKSTGRDRDLEIAVQITRTVGFDHTALPWRTASPDLLAVYDDMTGGLSVGGRRAAVGSCALAAGPYTHVNGNLGAVSIAYFWPCRNPVVVRSRALLREFCKKAPCIRDGVAEWLATVPQLPAPAVYNLMYLEQRGGRWMGIGETASCIFYDSFTPFCSRRFYEIASALPVEYQVARRLLPEVVERLVPQLALLPYYSGTDRFGRWLPKRVKGFLRQCLPRH